MRAAIPLLQDLLESSATRLPDKIALVCAGQRHTYKSLDDRANALGHFLQSQGLKRGDRVVIFADNTLETVISFWGILKAGGVVSIVNPLTKADKLAYMLNDCRPVALITDAHLANIFLDALGHTNHVKTVVISGKWDVEKFGHLPNPTPFESALQGPTTTPDIKNINLDLAAIIYTSGSTGDPKGVCLTHLNMTTAAESISTYLRKTENEVILSVLPLAFDYGLYQMIMAFRMGARLVLERSFAFPAAVLKKIAEEKVTGFPIVPTIVSVLMELKNIKDYDFSGIRYTTNTAAALTEKHIDFLLATFPNGLVFSMYGLTECKRCTYLPPEDIHRKKGSVGVAIPNTELWLEDEAGNRLPPNTVGQLVIRGATVMKGYWEKPEKTAEKLKPGPWPGEMVLHTGDFCRLDEEGYLYFVGRMDDVIKSRGEKVAPKEVESTIMNLKGVKEVAVIGVPDDLLGMAVKAFVVVEEGSQIGKQEILAQCQKHLENFMWPKHIDFVQDLPKTNTGKIKKTGLA